MVGGEGGSSYEFDRCGPVAPAPGAVHVSHPGTIGLVAAHGRGRGCDGGGEGVEFAAFPGGCPFKREGDVAAPDIGSMLRDTEFHGSEITGAVRKG